MSLIISGDILGVKGSEDKIFYIKDDKVVGIIDPDNFYNAFEEKDISAITGGDLYLASQALESYISNNKELPSGMVLSNEIMQKVDLSKKRPVVVKEEIKENKEKTKVKEKPKYRNFKREISRTKQKTMKRFEEKAFDKTDPAEKDRIND